MCVCVCVTVRMSLCVCVSRANSGVFGCVLRLFLFVHYICFYLLPLLCFYLRCMSPVFGLGKFPVFTCDVAVVGLVVVVVMVINAGLNCMFFFFCFLRSCFPLFEV